MGCLSLSLGCDDPGAAAGTLCAPQVDVVAELRSGSFIEKRQKDLDQASWLISVWRTGAHIDSGSHWMICVDAEEMGRACRSGLWRSGRKFARCFRASRKGGAAGGLSPWINGGAKIGQFGGVKPGQPEGIWKMAQALATKLSRATAHWRQVQSVAGTRAALLVGAADAGRAHRTVPLSDHAA